MRRIVLWDSAMLRSRRGRRPDEPITLGSQQLHGDRREEVPKDAVAVLTKSISEGRARPSIQRTVPAAHQRRDKMAGCGKAGTEWLLIGSSLSNS